MHAAQYMPDRMVYIEVFLEVRNGKNFWYKQKNRAATTFLVNYFQDKTK